MKKDELLKKWDKLTGELMEIRKDLQDLMNKNECRNQEKKEKAGRVNTSTQQ